MAFDTQVSQGDDGVVVMSFGGELDISRADQVELELERIEAGNPRVLVFDLRGLEFLDSTGLRIILGADTRARRDGRSLSIVRGPEKVQRVFRITLLDHRLNFVDEPGEAGEDSQAGD